MVARTKLTYAEYAKIAALPENEGRILELIDGEIVEKMPSAIPSEIAGNILFAFKLYLREHPIGYVTGEAGGFKMSETNTFNPDVGYISKARRPDKPERENLVPPDFAAEVKLPTDRVRALRRKAEAYP